MLKKIISIITCLAFVAKIGTAHAEVPVPETNFPSLPSIDVPPDEIDPGEAISPLKKNQKIPFTGLGISPRAILKINVWLKFNNERIEIEKNYVKEKMQAQCDYEVEKQKIVSKADIEVAQAKIESNLKQVELLQKQLKQEIESRPNVTLWTGLGILGGVGLTLLVVYAVK